jgi:NDP-hexose C3-ketoreductase / dTDP-4-oxo-2-deoxy-alpha-D-pentos-2-ene 2,3-reductase
MGHSRINRYREAMTMQYKSLGRSGLSVSRLCLGTMNFGPRTPEPDAHAIMDRALELGINFFDTANGYGSTIKHGLTAEIIGRWFAKGSPRRDRVVIATKVYAPMDPDWAPNKSGASARHMREQIDASLRRLQVDYIDIWQLHHISRATPVEEILQTFDVVIRQGKVLYAGSSNYAGWHIARFNERAAKRDMLGLVSEQCHYNLNNRLPELEVLPACRDYGLGVIPWSPLAGGLLAGTRRRGGDKPRRSDDKLQSYEKQLAAYGKLCDQVGAEPAQVALAWLLHNPVVTAPIIGPRTLEQLESALPAADLKLDDQVLKELDAIWPSPGGGKEAPEAWAW